MGKDIFSDSDYNSSNGMSTSIWGPCMWFSLHMISFNYPVKPTLVDKKNYKDWFLMFQYTLPCIYCRTNFKKNLIHAKFNDKVFTNRLTFSKFIFNLHECVNKMLGKNSNLTYEDVRNRYENFRSRCSEKEKKKVIVEQEKNLKKEKNCDSTLYVNKSKSVIRIVPKKSSTPGFKIDSKCKTKKSKK